MKPIASRALAALLLGLVSLSAAQAETKCKLVFEVIPSTDSGAIIGQSVEQKLAGKGFEKWADFTADQESPIFEFLQTNFPEEMEFAKPHIAMGGYQGKSSPNIIIEMLLEDSPEDDLGRAISQVTAAVGFLLIQDGTVAFCDKSVGKYGSVNQLYGVQPKANEGFKENLDGEALTDFMRTVYSAMVAANDDLNIGYTLFGNVMSVTELGTEKSDVIEHQVDRTNEYFAQFFASEVMIESYLISNKQPTIYEANDWALDRDGLALLAKVPEKVYVALLAARVSYRLALKKFAAAKD